jgi:hypothetical protein
MHCWKSPVSDLYFSVILTFNNDIRWLRHPSRCTALFGSCVHIHLTFKFKDVSSNYSILVDFLESIEQSMNRLYIYSEVPQTGTVTEIITKMMVELLLAIALVTKQIKQKRLSKFVHSDIPLD